jgi:uncharacterized membrane protein YhhN
MLRTRRIALVVFLVSVGINLVLEFTGPAEWVFLLRGLPVWALAVQLAATVRPARSWLVLAALLLGSVGDVVLAVRTTSHPVEFFLSGMGLFLIGHVCYIAAFAREADRRQARWWPAGLEVLLALVVGTLLVRALGAKAIPLLIYACALCGMGVAAALRGTNTVTVLAGAWLFLVSDALIAVHRFLTPLPLSGLAILSTYWAAQYLISEGWARDQLAREHSAVATPSPARSAA